VGPNSPSGRELQFLALGDSYTIGEGVSPVDSWPVQLVARMCQAGFSIGEPRIIAQTGWATGDLIQAMDRSDLPESFDLVSVSIGVNNQYQGRSVTEYERDFVAILARARQLAGNKSGRVIVLSIPDWGVSPFAFGRGRAAIAEQIERFNSVNRRAADQSQARYVDVTALSRAAAIDQSLFAADGLHFSSKMYQRWAELMFSKAAAAIASHP
jgi:lysophospholipase L1-like esterase